MKSNFVPCLALVVVEFLGVWGYPNGAPYSACVHLLPKHSEPRIPAQTSPTPYTLHMSSGTYSPGQELEVAIRSVSPAFNGWLLQVRRIDNNMVVGQFLSAPTGSMIVSCGGEQNALTHSNGFNFQNKTLIARWRAPSSDVGDLVLTGSVLQDYSTFWGPLKSDHVSPLPPEPSTTTTTTTTTAQPTTTTPITTQPTTTTPTTTQPSTTTPTTTLPTTTTATTTQPAPTTTQPTTTSSTTQSTIKTEQPTTSTATTPAVQQTSATSTQQSITSLQSTTMATQKPSTQNPETSVFTQPSTQSTPTQPRDTTYVIPSSTPPSSGETTNDGIGGQGSSASRPVTLFSPLFYSLSLLSLYCYSTNNKIFI